MRKLGLRLRVHKYLDLALFSKFAFLPVVPLSTTHPNLSATMFRQIALLALALVPSSLAQITEGFESGLDATAWPTYAPDCNQGGKVTLDTSQAHSGKNSVRVDGAGGFCGHIFFGTTKIPSGDIYVRVWL